MNPPPYKPPKPSTPEGEARSLILMVSAAAGIFAVATAGVPVLGLPVTCLSYLLQDHMETGIDAQIIVGLFVAFVCWAVGTVFQHKVANRFRDGMDREAQRLIRREPQGKKDKPYVVSGE
jgi:hypothetical protein